MEVMEKEDRYGAHNYHPLPVALCKGQGKAEEGGYDVGVVMMLDFSMTFQEDKEFLNSIIKLEVCQNDLSNYQCFYLKIVLQIS